MVCEFIEFMTLWWVTGLVLQMIYALYQIIYHKIDQLNIEEGLLIFSMSFLGPLVVIFIILDVLTAYGEINLWKRKRE